MADLLVKDIMTYGIKTIAFDETIKKAACIMADEKVSFLPVTDEKNNCIGVITRKDIAFRIIQKAKNPEDVLVCSVMSAPITSINENLTVRELGKILSERKCKRLLVESSGKFIGVVSNTDILKAVANNKI